MPVSFPLPASALSYQSALARVRHLPVILAQCGPRDGSSVFEPRAIFSGATMSKKKKNGLGQRRVGDQRRRARTEKAGDLDFNFPIREASCQPKSYR